MTVSGRRRPLGNGARPLAAYALLAACALLAPVAAEARGSSVPRRRA
jgi:hypothetical protein